MKQENAQRETLPSPIQAHNVRWLALGLVIVCYWLAGEPTTSRAERSELGLRFRFSKHIIDTEQYAIRPLVKWREVHPELERIKSWISGTGAAATVADLDSDGLHNDLLLVDSRLNSMLIMPVPGTGERFEPFTLEPTELPFDPKTMSPTGSLVGDFNEDGFLDIFVYYWGRTPVLFLQSAERSKDGHSTPSASNYSEVELLNSDHGIPDRWYTHAATQADVDGDGHLDLLIGNFFQDNVDILNPHASGNAVVMQAGKSKATNGGGAKLFLWKAPSLDSPVAVEFNDASTTLTEHCGNGWVLAMGAADLDPDAKDHKGLPEIYVAHDFGPDRLLHNRSVPGKPRFALCEGRRGFTTPKSFALGNDSFKGMGLDFADINNDGLFDIYISNIADNFALHESHFCFVSDGNTADFSKGIAPYSQQSESLGLSRSGWGWDCRFVDFDNDGVLEAVQATGFVKGTVSKWADLHSVGTTNDQLVSNPKFWPRMQPPLADLSGHNVNPFFVRSANGRYTDIASELSLDDFWNTRGLAISDVDGDGLVDFVAANQWEPSVVFRNQSPRINGFLGLQILLSPNDESGSELWSRPGNPSGDTIGIPAIGAVVSAKLSDGRRLTSQIDGGSGHSGKRSPTVHFGLGPQPPESVEVRIRWRGRHGKMHDQRLRLKTNLQHTVVLGESKSEEEV